MERVTKIRLKNQVGTPGMYFQFHQWYVKIGEGSVYHYGKHLKTDDNFDKTPENEHFNDIHHPYNEGDEERFKKDVIEQEAFLKSNYGSLSKAFRAYNDPSVMA